MAYHTPQLRGSHLLVAACSFACAAASSAQTIVEHLGGGSTFQREDCLGPCACPIGVPVVRPLTGTFTLTFNHSDMWTSYYDVSAVDFVTSTVAESDVRFTGGGTYHIGGDFALTHRLVLDLVQTGTGETFQFDSDEVVIMGGDAHFPEISITVTTGVVVCTRRTLVIRAAPGDPPVCAADIGAQGGVSGSDGHLDNNDFIVFIDAFFNANPLADRGTQGGTPGSDGAFDNNDFIVFLDQFFNATGC